MNNTKKELEKLKKIIEGKTGIECDWKITLQDKFNEHGRIRNYDDDSPITNNLYLSAIKIVLLWDRASSEMLTRRLIISSALAIRLTDKMTKDGILIPYPEIKDKTAMLFTVNQELGKKLTDFKEKKVTL